MFLLLVKRISLNSILNAFVSNQWLPFTFTNILRRMDVIVHSENLLFIGYFKTIIRHLAHRSGATEASGNKKFVTCCHLRRLRLAASQSFFLGIIIFSNNRLIQNWAKVWNHVNIYEIFWTFVLILCEAFSH